MVLKGFCQANVYVEGQGIVKKTIRIEDGKIAKICDCKDVEGFEKLDENLIVVPGFIDKHIHGANNSDGMYDTLEDAKNISKIVATEGVSSYLITTMTQTEENIDKALSNAKKYIEQFNC